MRMLALYRRNFRKPDGALILAGGQENPDLQWFERAQRAGAHDA